MDFGLSVIAPVLGCPRSEEEFVGEFCLKVAFSLVMWTWLHLPGGLVQHGFHLVNLILTKVDHGEMNPAVLLDANFSEPKKKKKTQKEALYK